MHERFLGVQEEATEEREEEDNSYLLYQDPYVFEETSGLARSNELERSGNKDLIDFEEDLIDLSEQRGVVERQVEAESVMSQRELPEVGTYRLHSEVRVSRFDD